MLNTILAAGNTTAELTIGHFLVCSSASIIMGIIAAVIHMYKNQYSKNFIVTLTLLPVIVQMVIMLVNGNLGTGVAVMGAFSLVRFRSAPGNSREIGSIFMAMAIGLATGTGYLGVAVLFLIIIGLATVLLNTISFGEHSKKEKDLKITIPENLDYNGIFDDILKKYTEKAQLMKVKTTNMGSLFELQYIIQLKKEGKEKEFLDALRCRNGNLMIVCGRIADHREEL